MKSKFLKFTDSQKSRDYKIDLLETIDISLYKPDDKLKEKFKTFLDTE